MCLWQTHDRKGTDRKGTSPQLEPHCNMFLFPQYASNARRHDETYARRFEEEDNDADNDACAYDSAYTHYYNDRD